MDDENLERIASSLEALIGKISAPNMGTLSTFQETVAQLNEIQNQLHRTNSALESINETIHEMGKNIEFQFIQKR
jgi:chromosome segregation ATPase